MCSATVYIYIYIYRERLVRNSDSLLSHKSATDVVCCMQGYDHGSAGSSSWSSYGGLNLRGMLGNTLVNEVQCGGSASEFSGCCLVISCVAGVNGLRPMRVSQPCHGCCSFLCGGKRTGVHADGTLTDTVCRMQGYDHGIAVSVSLVP